MISFTKHKRKITSFCWREKSPFIFGSPWTPHPLLVSTADVGLWFDQAFGINLLSSARVYLDNVFSTTLFLVRQTCLAFYTSKLSCTLIYCQSKELWILTVIYLFDLIRHHTWARHFTDKHIMPWTGQETSQKQIFLLSHMWHVVFSWQYFVPACSLEAFCHAKSILWQSLEIAGKGAGQTGRKVRELWAPQGVVSRPLDTQDWKAKKKKKQRKLNPPIFHVVCLSKETNI